MFSESALAHPGLTIKKNTGSGIGLWSKYAVYLWMY